MSHEPPIVDLDGVRSSRRRAAERGNPDWLDGAVVDDRGRTLPVLRNVTLALRSAPEIAEAFAFDELERMVVVTQSLPLAAGAEPRAIAAPPRPLTDADISQVQEWLQSIGLPRVGSATVHQAVILRAQERAFHPIRRYLDALAWDARPRLSAWLSAYLGAEATRYTMTIGRMFLTAAVARVMAPGSQADYALILEGPQGAGKSRACRVLGGDWFSDALPDVSREKEAAQHLRGKWLVEVAELSALNRAESEALKAFISRRVERYRPPYGREEVVEPRQCVFVGTTNRAQYLRDETGARRFWPVRVGVIELDGLARDRDQLFAEAVAAYRNGEQWWPSADFEREHIRPEQESRFEADAWESAIEAHVIGRDRVQVSEIAREALGFITAKVGTAEQRRITRVLERLGWSNIKDWKGRAWVRSNHDA